MQTSDSSAFNPPFDGMTFNCTPLSEFDAIMKDLISSLQSLSPTPFDIGLTWTGTPYHPKASLKGIGCDCVGLIQGIWNEFYTAPLSHDYQNLCLYCQGLTPLKTLEAVLETLFIPKPIPTTQTGDIMVFEMTSRGHAHTGLYAPEGGLLHAVEKTGVVYERTIPPSLKKRWVRTYGWKSINN